MIRILPSDEWEKVQPVFQDLGGTLPRPDLALIVVQEDEAGRLQGLITAQWAPHLEPIWIAPEDRGHVMWPRLVETAESALGVQPVYAFGASPLVERMIQGMGGIRLPWSVWRRG